MPELDPAITQLIAAGRERLARQRAEQRAKRDAEAAKRQAQINEQIAGLHQAVMALLPEALHPYCSLLCDDSEPLNGWQFARLEVPGCSPITITVEVNYYWANTNGEYVRVTNYLPVKRDTYPLFQVERYQLAFDDDEGVYSVTEHIELTNDTHYGSNDLDVALAVAAEWWARRADLEAQAQTKTAEEQAKRASRKTAAEDVEQHQTTEREALLDLLSDDPVLIALLKIAVSVKQERAGYAESIERLHDALDSQIERHARQLTEQQRAAELAIRARQAEVDIAQREADDLQVQLARIKRQAQYA